MYESLTVSVIVYVPAAVKVSVGLVAALVPFTEKETAPGDALHVYLSDPVPVALPVATAVVPITGLGVTLMLSPDGAAGFAVVLASLELPESPRLLLGRPSRATEV